MATIFGAVGLNDNDYVFNGTVGQQAIYDVVNQAVMNYNYNLGQMMSTFISGMTENHTERFYLPAGGIMASRALGTRAPATKQSGSWDVAYRLDDFGGALWGDKVSMAYLTAAKFQAHLSSIFNMHTGRVRLEVLKALLDSAADTFVDPLHGSLTIQPLANGDTVVYPPVLGSDTEATDNHYLESGYAASAISDTNNPYNTIVDEIEEHFGTATGGENIVVFINNAQRALTEDLSAFVDEPDRFIRVGDNTDVPQGLPNVPGRILGRVEGRCWVVEWRWMPANYMFGLHLEAEAPLKMRVDPAFTGLPRQLTLVSEDAEHPFEAMEYQHRFGLGVANRLNGVVMELGTGGTYTVPTAYD